MNIKEKTKEILDMIQLADLAIEGIGSPLSIFALGKMMENVGKSIQEKIKPEAVEEVEEHGGKAEFEGFKFEKRSSTRYDYSACKAWKDAKTEQIEVEKHRKMLEKEMQSMAKNDQYDKTVVDANGVEHKLVRPIALISDTVIVKPSKS